MTTHFLIFSFVTFHTPLLVSEVSMCILEKTKKVLSATSLRHSVGDLTPLRIMNLYSLVLFSLTGHLRTRETGFLIKYSSWYCAISSRQKYLFLSSLQGVDSIRTLWKCISGTCRKIVLSY